MAKNRNLGEKKAGSESVKPAHCIIRRQFRAAEFRALYCTASCFEMSRPELSVRPKRRRGGRGKRAAARNSPLFRSILRWLLFEEIKSRYTLEDDVLALCIKLNSKTILLILGGTGGAMAGVIT
ncbi:hypothetical protein EVAR_76643_1 [Eumeta japonica]|uniref:Uncharacterized protein n=1 Tax=Eumeta variegata TaxID=151549 RepID=A0A4C1T8Q6_EUMVA|nr:hypothetical protein EVAR_76643_1 [Eumeta japonica]